MKMVIQHFWLDNGPRSRSQSSGADFHTFCVKMDSHSLRAERAMDQGVLALVNGTVLLVSLMVVVSVFTGCPQTASRLCCPFSVRVSGRFNVALHTGSRQEGPCPTGDMAP